MTTAVALDQVCFSYGTQPIFHNLSLEIAEGDFVGLIGPNGGGKTTLVKLIMGLLEPDSGTILHYGHSCDEVCSHMGYVPQSLPFDRSFPLTVLELVLSGTLSRLTWYGAYPKASKEAAQIQLERVSLSHKTDASVGTLSGGELQRALIARALVTEPQLLLLDEPTASIDPRAEDALYALLAQLHQQMTIVMVSHDLNHAAKAVDRFLVVQNGVSSLKPEEVCDHFAFGLYPNPEEDRC